MSTGMEIRTQQVLPVTTEPVQADPQVFDRADLLWRVEGDAELADEVVQIFLDEGPTMLDRVRKAAASGDAAAVRFTAHALKGAAANISAHNVSAAALRLEMMGREGQLAAVQQGVATLEAEIARLEDALRPKPQGRSV